MAIALLGFIVSFAVVVPLTVGARALAPRLGLIDVPTPRKRHPLPTAATGGIAVFLAFTLPLVAALLIGPRLASGDLDGGSIGVLAALLRRAPESWTVLAHAGALHLLGILDDRLDLGPLVKLAGQIAIAASLVLALDLYLLPALLVPPLAAAASVLWLVATINAFNFLDGMDGLMASVACVSAAMLLLFAFTTGQGTAVLPLSCLLGALAGFLLFNLPPARIFMGDGGSIVVGFLLAYYSLDLVYFDFRARASSPWYSLLTPALILSVPLYDVASVTVRRLLQGRSPLRADNQHVTDRLLAAGLTPRGVRALLTGLTLASGLAGAFLGRMGPSSALLLLGLVALALASLGSFEAWRARPAPTRLGGAAKQSSRSRSS